MNTRDDMIRKLTEQLGNEASRDDGVVVFNYLRETSAITWHDVLGYVLADDTNILAAYAAAVR